MSIVDLNSRLTDNWDKFCKSTKSSDSLIFIDKKCNLDDGPTSVDLTVGSRCFLQRDGKYYTIPDDGIRLAPSESILIETCEIIALPYNTFGFVTGKGKLIFQGTFVSAGKIDPGFNSKLNIGLYNGGNKSILIKKGAALCSCVFIQTESSTGRPSKSSGRFQHESVELMSKWQKMGLWIRRKHWLLPIIISILAMLAALGNFLVNLFS